MRVTIKGQVTIPQHIRELANIRPHTEVEFYYEEYQDLYGAACVPLPVLLAFGFI